MLDFLLETRNFEIIAASIGFIAIYLQIKQISWYWPVSLVMVVMYIFVYYNTKIYGDMSLQFYYLGVSLYGWYLWLFGAKQNGKQKSIEVSSTSKHLWYKLALANILLYIGMVWFLKTYTDSEIPFIDSLTTSSSFIATWMLAKKKLENWIIWIVVDFISIGLYYNRELYPTMILFAVLTVLAFVGYFQWKKSLPENATV